MSKVHPKSLVKTTLQSLISMAQSKNISSFMTRRSATFVPEYHRSLGLCLCHCLLEDQPYVLPLHLDKERPNQGSVMCWSEIP